MRDRKSPSSSRATVAKVSAAPAASSSTVRLMARTVRWPHVSSTCVTSAMVTPSPSSRGELNAFPVIKDLVVDRSAFDRSSRRVATSPSAPALTPMATPCPIPKDKSDHAFDMAACIGCGACVAACPNASASLFTAAKISHLALLPQGQAERGRRVKRMVDRWMIEVLGTARTSASARQPAREDPAGEHRAHEARVPARSVSPHEQIRGARTPLACQRPDILLEDVGR